MGNGAQTRRLIRMAAIFAAALAIWSSAAQAACRQKSVDIRGSWGQARFSVEIADTGRTRMRGLMHRQSLRSSAGMLFIYDSPSRQTFWMKNTLIPLDIIFVGSNGVVKNIHHRAQPHDQSLLPSKGEVIMVLEISGGLAKRMGISAGSELRHPRLDQRLAVWPCH